MASSTISEPFVRNMKMFQIVLSGTETGFKIEYGSSTFVLIYADVYGRLAFISKDPNSNPSITMLNGAFQNTAVSDGSLYLRTGSYVRGYFILGTGGAVTITSYTS